MGRAYAAWPAILVVAALAGCAGLPTTVEAAIDPPWEPRPTRTAAPESATFDLAMIDGTTWCSERRGDCLEIDLPVIIGFGGRVSGAWPPQSADPDGCFRLHGGASFDLWFCPVGAAADVSSRPTSIDDDRTDVDRLIVKFKAEDGWVYVRR